MQNNCEVIASNHFVRWLLLMCYCRVHKESRQSTSSITPGVDELLLGRGRRRNQALKQGKKKSSKTRPKRREFLLRENHKQTPATK